MTAIPRCELTGANVLIIGTTFGASADAYGKYVIQAVPAGSYSVQCTYLGYGTRVIPDIIIKPGRTIQVNIELMASAIETGGVTVTPSYFAATEAEPVSAVQMSYEEIRESAGISRRCEPDYHVTAECSEGERYPE